MTDPILLSGDRLDVAISPLGAELQSIVDADGNDWLWDGDPAVWSGRAPLLFPIVGRLTNDLLHVDGRSFPMAKHGFARRSRFEMIGVESDHALFRLEDSAETRTSYPYPFRLDVSYRIAGNALDITASLLNPGTAPLPASFGFHPALRWPLPGGVERSHHRILFDAPEPAPIRRIADDGLLTPVPRPSPVEGSILALTDDLFVEDAVIFDRLASRSLTYEAIGGSTVQVDFHGLPHLGIWTKPGAPYLCIEPWQGFSDPAGFEGDITNKPGIVLVPPGDTREFAMRMRFNARDEAEAPALG
ncbi:aldose 1-epimerase family protein [Sphingomonas sp. 1P06PA]|uniref:aldose 1-epimerase family protein n=1 Tax=Sphingomonas sp. 1P06PA TaxID=554121 RepID=UPI0039A43370